MQQCWRAVVQPRQDGGPFRGSLFVGFIPQAQDYSCGSPRAAQTLSVSLILECLAAGMSSVNIEEAFGHAFPHEAMPGVLKAAAELTNFVHVVA